MTVTRTLPARRVEDRPVTTVSPDPVYLAAVLGPRLARLLTTPDQQAVAARIIRQIADRECPGVARAWMTGMNPHLGDEAPLLAIVDGLASDVEAAARAYLDGVWT